MNKQELRVLRNTELSYNEDGEFYFVKSNQHKNVYKVVYGPVTFGEALRICWACMDEYRKEKEEGQE